MSQMPNSTLPVDAGFSATDLSASDLTTFDSQADGYPEAYFDALYQGNGDPWQYQTRWYEKRKRDMCLAALPQANYINGVELGCGNGVFSELLAGRCQSLLSIDGNQKAVQLAKQRLVNHSNIKVVQGVIPQVLAETPINNNQSYDLIVISEILYYLPLADIDQVISWIEQSLALSGTLLCCHWRYEIEGFVMTGESVHQHLQQAFNKNSAFTHQSQLVDSDFLLDVWQRSAQTIAMQEQLI
ncbi:nodulation S family protein [Psychrobacter sp. AH5]|uniref:class I SAM-dependent DNA methyltransferase n=1 Tax=Psychrobacter sp. AH5 TaxID=2937433 RepID=UPI00333F13FC